ncbi:MAG TPA: hypothetical protein VN608_10925 [Clostridia bacterium]|nr:hypothetical protein [Clostridia bacterium]
MIGTKGSRLSSVSAREAVGLGQRDAAGRGPRKAEGLGPQVSGYAGREGLQLR